MKRFRISAPKPIHLSVLFLVSLVLGVASTEVPDAAAQGGGLVVIPQLVEFDSRKRSEALTLVNRGREPQTYRLTVVNFRMEADGSLVPTDEPGPHEGFAAELIRYAPRQITLEPGEAQTVRVLYRRPKNLDVGEYRSHLFFQQVPKAAPVTAGEPSGSGLSMQIRTVFGVSIPVIVRHGALQATASLPALSPAPLADGSPALAVTVARTGNQSLRGDLVALADGEEVGRINNIAVYLSTGSRTVTLRLDPEKAGALSGRELVVEYRARPNRGGGQLAAASLRMP